MLFFHGKWTRGRSAWSAHLSPRNFFLIEQGVPPHRTALSWVFLQVWTLQLFLVNGVNVLLYLCPTKPHFYQHLCIITHNPDPAKSLHGHRFVYAWDLPGFNELFICSLLKRLKLYLCFMYVEKLLHSNRVQTGAPRFIRCLTRLVHTV